MKHRILIENQQEERRPFRGYKTLLRRAVSAALEAEGFIQKAEISVILVSREEICRLNARFRNTPRETDVLSFPLSDVEDDLYGDTVLLGDIVVCPDVIFSQAASFGTTYAQEFCLMVIHSTLHLLGWDHMEEEEKQKMFSRQEAILDSLGEGEVKTEE